MGSFKPQFRSGKLEFLFGIRNMDADHLFDPYGKCLTGRAGDSDILIKEISSFVTFLHGMYRANKPLISALSSSQFGDDRYVLDLSQKIVEICERNLTKHKEEGYG